MRLLRSRTGDDGGASASEPETTRRAGRVNRAVLGGIVLFSVVIFAGREQGRRADDARGEPAPVTSAPPALALPSTSGPEATTTTSTIAPAPWLGFEIDEPARPVHEVADWDASARDPANRHSVSTAGDLDGALELAGSQHRETGHLQDVILDGGRVYEISEPITVPTGVRLRGRENNEDLSDQVLAAAPDFPADRAMVALSDDTALTHIELDGRDTAWRIASVPGSTDVTIHESSLHGTNSRIGFVGPPFVTGGTRPHTDIVYFAAGSQRLLINGSRLEAAGINPSLDGRGADPTRWSAFSTAVDADATSDVTITGNRISEIATAGISLLRAERVAIVGNDIRNVSRNIEWWTKNGPVVLGDAITGYNHSAGSLDEGERHWIIADNDILNSGNNGLHLSGMTIFVGGNDIRKVQQVHLFLGGTLSGDQFDCVEHLRVEGNSLKDTTYDRRYTTGSQLPKIRTNLVLVRHFVDATEQPEAVLVAADDISGFAPADVEFADDPRERYCDERMADP